MFVRGVVQSTCLVDVLLCIFNAVIFDKRILFFLFHNLYAILFCCIVTFCFAKVLIDCQNAMGRNPVFLEKKKRYFSKLMIRIKFMQNSYE